MYSLIEVAYSKHFLILIVGIQGLWFVTKYNQIRSIK